MFSSETILSFSWRIFTFLYIYFCTFYLFFYSVKCYPIHFIIPYQTFFSFFFEAIIHFYKLSENCLFLVEFIVQATSFHYCLIQRVLHESDWQLHVYFTFVGHQSSETIILIKKMLLESVFIMTSYNFCQTFSINKISSLFGRFLVSRQFSVCFLKSII